ncbi:MAG: YggS family pyridoxal phosphate-dependent enzyme [Spirochaetota bacterium]
MVTTIHENLKRLKETVTRTLLRIGREDEVTIIAVTKTVPPERINVAIDAGIKIIGENRVQEALEKHGKVKEGVQWHMVGHLQRNKVKHAIGIFQMIQSIDKIETAIEIEKRATSPVDILIEINSSGEETKSGINPNRLFYLVDEIQKLKMVSIKGLMTIGPFTDDVRAIRRAFQITRSKYDELGRKYPNLDLQFLSMGMSADYQIAIEEGSNMIRIGTAIFGERKV